MQVRTPDSESDERRQASNVGERGGTSKLGCVMVQKVNLVPILRASAAPDKPWMVAVNVGRAEEMDRERRGTRL